MRDLIIVHRAWRNIGCSRGFSCGRSCWNSRFCIFILAAKRITRMSKLDEDSRPWIEEPRPFRARAPTPILTTVATDNISYPRSDISTPAVSPSAYERSMSGHTRGNYSVTSTAITGQNTQLNPPDYEEGMLQGRGGGYSQSRRDNLPIKLRNK